MGPARVDAEHGEGAGVSVESAQQPGSVVGDGGAVPAGSVGGLRVVVGPAQAGRQAEAEPAVLRDELVQKRGPDGKKVKNHDGEDVLECVWDSRS
jgi:hypothetical protein